MIYSERKVNILTNRLIPITVLQILHKIQTRNINNAFLLKMNRLLSNAFLYIPGTGYAQKDTIYNSIDYWLKFNAYQTIPLEGIPILSDTIDVVEGWNLIGCISETVLVSNITSEPENIITSNFYGYNNGYFITTELLPAKAYWVKVNQNGKLFLNSTKK